MTEMTTRGVAMSVEAEPVMPAVSKRRAPNAEEPQHDGDDADRIVPDDEGDDLPHDVEAVGEDDAAYPIELFYDD
jgi:hypothetical protein